MEAGRAYSTFTVKALSDDQREFTGLATSPVHDRVNDSIDPLGCKFKNPTVLLRSHDHQAPIGEVHFDRPTKAGVTFRARIPRIDEPGLLKDRCDMAWGEVKHGIVRAVSIGFRPLKQPSPNEKGGLDFPSVEIFELSTVAVPAMQLATIDHVKAIDAAVIRGELPAASQVTRSRLKSLIAAVQDAPDANEARELLIASAKQAIDDVYADKGIARTDKSGTAALAAIGVVARDLANLSIALERRVIDRVDALGRRLDEAGQAYKGVWKPGAYKAGAFVTHSGSMWHADTDTSFQPGEGGGWTLAVKAGRPGKDAGR